LIFFPIYPAIVTKKDGRCSPGERLFVKRMLKYLTPGPSVDITTSPPAPLLEERGDVTAKLNRIYLDWCD